MSTPRTTTSEPVLVTMSILAGLQFLFAGGAGVSLVADNPLVAGLFAVGMLGTAAAQTGVQFYVRGKVTPNDRVAYQVADDGTLAPGAGAPDGLVEEQPLSPATDQLGNPVELDEAERGQDSARR